MNHGITTKTKLSIDQQKTLAEIISDQSGPYLSFDKFTDQVLMLFEDISGALSSCEGCEREGCEYECAAS